MLVADLDHDLQVMSDCGWWESGATQLGSDYSVGSRVPGGPATGTWRVTEELLRLEEGCRRLKALQELR